jgi:hypothetical protein
MKRAAMKGTLTATAAAVALLATAAAAFADVHVPRHQTVNELRVIGQDVTIDGTARGPVFVVGGNVSVGPTGQAANLTVIAGQIRTAPGAQLHGDVFQFGGPLPELNGWSLAAALLAALALHTLLVWIVVSAGVRFAAIRQVQPLALAFRDRPARTAVAGVLASAGLIALSLLLLLTVVGIPIALMIWGLLIVAAPLGVATLSQLLPELPRGRSLLLVAAIPLVGDALLALAMAVGTGALLRVIARARLDLDAVPFPRY